MKNKKLKLLKNKIFAKLIADSMQTDMKLIDSSIKDLNTLIDKYPVKPINPEEFVWKLI